MIDPKKLAEELISVQPMPDNAIKDLYEASKSEEELRAEGYKPVSGLGLTWIKDDEE
jgi:hypothetical protein